MSDPRHNSRLLAIQKLFQTDFNQQDDIESSISNFPFEEIVEIDSIKKYDKHLYKEILDGIQNKKESIDKVISILAPEWPLDKISRIDLQIMRIAILEGFVLKITPEKVAVNEAIELAKDFSNEQSRKFVSGVLGALITRVEEFKNYFQ